jgi:hypothetical protein
MHDAVQQIQIPMILPGLSEGQGQGDWKTRPSFVQHKTKFEEKEHRGRKKV